MKHRPLFRDDQVWVQRRMCDTCIFRPGNKMMLNEGRVEQMVKGCGDTGVIPCHEHMDTKTPGVCKGFYSKHRNQILQIAQRLGRVKFQ